MFLAIPLNLIQKIFEKKKYHQQEKLIKTTTIFTQTTTTTTSNFYSPIINTTQIKQTTQQIITHIKTITFYTYSSMINTTLKTNITIRNKMFISLFITLIIISLCISISYFIMIYFRYYLTMKPFVKQNLSIFNRESFSSSEDSNSDKQSYILVKTINDKNKERHSLTDSIKLFRY
ncbi:unnamed protein product [Rotaria sp. Silwood1]|nr:unnamed protein product [Rotaria sp. Silwood1]